MIMNFDNWMEDCVNGGYGPELDRLEAEDCDEPTHGDEGEVDTSTYAQEE